LAQDLEPFRLDNYRASDAGDELLRLKAFVSDALTLAGGQIYDVIGSRLVAEEPGSASITFSTDRDEAMADETLALLGLEHLLVSKLLQTAQELPAEARALLVDGNGPERARAIWEVRLRTPAGSLQARLFNARLDESGRLTWGSYAPDRDAWSVPRSRSMPRDLDRAAIVRDMQESLRRHLAQTGLLEDGATFSTRLVCWVETANNPHSG
jgi:hypothetical protein